MLEVWPSIVSKLLGMPPRVPSMWPAERTLVRELLDPEPGPEPMNLPSCMGAQRKGAHRGGLVSGGPQRDNLRGRCVKKFRPRL